MTWLSQHLQGHGVHGPVEFLLIFNALFGGMAVDIYQRVRRR